MVKSVFLYNEWVYQNKFLENDSLGMYYVPFESSVEVMK